MENKGINSLLARAFTSNDAVQALIDLNSRVIDVELTSNPNLTTKQKILLKQRYNLPGAEPLDIEQAQSIAPAFGVLIPDINPVGTKHPTLLLSMDLFYQALLYGSFLSPGLVKEKYVTPIQAVADPYGYEFYKVFFGLIEGWKGSLADLVEVTRSLLGQSAET